MAISVSPMLGTPRARKQAGAEHRGHAPKYLRNRQRSCVVSRLIPSIVGASAPPNLMTKATGRRTTVELGSKNSAQLAKATGCESRVSGPNNAQKLVASDSGIPS